MGNHDAFEDDPEERARVSRERLINMRRKQKREKLFNVPCRDLMAGEMALIVQPISDNAAIAANQERLYDELLRKLGIA
jgi:hypothetical protein